MVYRDDEEARRLRRGEIERELTEVERSLDSLARLRDRRAVLERELEASFGEGAAERKRRLPLLSTLTVKSPCKEPWTAMRGDDRVRHCARCDKDVFDLSALRREEAEALLAASHGSLCVRYFVRPDGTVMTSECAPARRTRRVRAFGLAAGLGLGAAGAALGLDAADRGEELLGVPAVQGEVALDPAPAPDDDTPAR